MLRSGASPFSMERISLLWYADFCDLLSSFKENVFLSLKYNKSPLDYTSDFFSWNTSE